MLAPETWPMICTILVLAITVVFFTIGKVRSDIVALGASLALMLLGVLTPQEALSGFSNTIIPTIAGVFVIGGAIVRSGLANVISANILKIAGKNHHALFMLVMLITAAIGSLVSNTGTVAIMMPIVVSMAMSIDASPSRFLMPLAFMSSIGGMLTLIGNAGNMVVNDIYVKAGFESLTLFSFLPVGLVCLAFGMLVLAPVTSFFLARRKNEKRERKDKGLSLRELADKYHLTQNMYKIVVPANSSLVGKSLMDLNLTGKYGVGIHEIRRRKSQHGHFGPIRFEQIDPGPATVIEADDIIYGLGSFERVCSLVDECQLNLAPALDKEDPTDKYLFHSIGICELVLMSSSQLVKQTVAESNLREQFGISILGIQRGNQYILENVRDQVMQSGDALLVQGTWEHIARLAKFPQNWVVVGRPQDHMYQGKAREKIPFVCIVVALMVLSMTLGVLPTVVSVLLAAIALVLGGCFRNVEEAYATINWETLVMIACMLPFAIAMEKSGLIDILSRQMSALGVQYGPWISLAVIYALASGLNILISGTPVALLVAPLAIQLAIDLHCSPLPFVFGVACAACMCFASPFSTPSNALVMSAGRYTFFDYLKLGLPLQALMGVIMVLVLPLLFPF